MAEALAVAKRRASPLPTCGEYKLDLADLCQDKSDARSLSNAAGMSCIVWQCCIVRHRVGRKEIGAPLWPYSAHGCGVGASATNFSRLPGSCAKSCADETPCQPGTIWVESWAGLMQGTCDGVGGRTVGVGDPRRFIIHVTFRTKSAS